MFEGVSVIDDLGHRIPALGPKALGLECGALGRQYPLTPSNMGLEYLIPFLLVHILYLREQSGLAHLFFISDR